MNDRIGHQFGNYRITRLLGHGGFAEVYLAEHIHLGTQAAVKLLNGKITAQAIQAFQTEAQAIASLKHPHILRILEFGFEETVPFLIMEYAPGGTLRDMYPLGTPLQLPLVLSFVKQVASALAYAHSRKLIHRDVKPENMLIDANDTVLLSDFGIVALAHSTTSMKTIDSTGTIYYMAPEQIKGKPRRESDQYALGIVVYEWLSGERPFTGDSSIEIAMKHLSETPPSLRAKGIAVSTEVEQVLLRALAKEPQQRFPDILAFAHALEQADQPSAENSPTAPKKSQASQIAIAQLLGEGEVLFSHKRYDEALRVFDQALQINPYNILALSWKAASLEGLQRYGEALAFREQAISNGSTAKEDYVGKGAALSNLQRYDEALKAIDQALQIDPMYVNAYYWKGRVLYHLRRYDEAIATFDQALLIDPHNVLVPGWKAAALYALGRYDEALMAREQAISNGSTAKEDYQGKGVILYQLQRYDEAIRAFDQVLQIDPQDTSAHTWKAKAMTQQRIAQQKQ